MSKEASPPRPANTPRTTAEPLSSTLTAAAWNRRQKPRRLHGPAQWPRWLRSIPDAERSGALSHLFTALFFAIPGAALAFAGSLRASAALSLAVLLFVAVHAALHVLSALHHARRGIASPLLRSVDRHLPCLMVAGTLIPLAAHAGGHVPMILLALAWLASGVLVASSMHGVPAHPTWRGVLRTASAALLLLAAVLLSLPVAGPLLAWLLAGALCCAASLGLQWHPRHRLAAMLRHGLLPLGSLCHFIAVALIAVPAA